MKSPVIRRFKLHSTALLFALAVDLSATPAPRPWPPHAFEPVTIERIENLPAAEQPAWRTYLEASRARAKLLPPRTAPDFSPSQPLPGLPKGGAHTQGVRLGETAAWYASSEARTIAARILAAQSANGAWTKGNNYTASAASESHEPIDIWSAGTFDNDATVPELRFLARVATAGGETAPAKDCRAAFLHGLEYCFAAQYPNGGFPQIYPLAGGYHDAITYNDDAMANVLGLLRDIAAGGNDYKFVSAAKREEAARRFVLGVACVLATQLKTASGERTVWCQQYDALTLAPCAARNFEPAAACVEESTGLLELLMKIPSPSPAIITAVESGVTWLKRTALHDLKWEKRNTEGSGLVSAPGARLWARYYELETDAPIFGDRDRTIHYSVTELSPERRLGYSWYGDWATRALELHAKWRPRIATR